MFYESNLQHSITRFFFNQYPAGLQPSTYCFKRQMRVMAFRRRFLPFEQQKTCFADKKPVLMPFLAKKELQLPHCVCTQFMDCGRDLFLF